MTYDVTLRGFNPVDPTTDHRVKWVVTPSEAVLMGWLEKNGLLNDLSCKPFQLAEHDRSFADGVDVRLTEDGKAEFPPGKDAKVLVEWILPS